MKILHYFKFHIFIGTSILLLFGSCDHHDKDQFNKQNNIATQLIKSGNDYFHNGEYDSALNLADSALSLSPGKPNGYYLKGLVLSKLQHYDSALVVFRKTHKLDSDFKGVNSQIGTLYLRKQDFKKAIYWYKNEVLYHPNSSIDWVNLGFAYSSIDSTQKAIETYKTALSIDSTNAIAAMALSEELKNQGDFTKALKFSRNAIELEPDNIKFMTAHAMLLHQMGDTDEAIHLLQDAIVIDPFNYRAHYTLGRAYIRSGRIQLGRKHLSKADTLRNFETIIDRLKRQTRMNPDNLPYWGVLIDALENSGRYKEAIEAAKVALGLDSDNIYIREHLAQLYLSIGDSSHALDQYKAIIRKHPNMVEFRNIINKLSSDKSMKVN